MFAVSAPMISESEMSMILADVNAKIESGESVKKLLPDLSVSRIINLERELENDGWSKIRSKKLAKLSEAEYVYAKGSAKLYAMASEFLGSFVSIEVVN